MSEASVGEDVSGMDESIEHLRCLLHQVTLIVLQFIVWLQVEDGVQGLAVVGHLLIQTSQVKLVLNVVFVNLIRTVQ